MFDLGLQELIVIFAVALIVFGPKRLPELAKALGKGIGHAKKAMSDIKQEVEREANLSEDLLEGAAGKPAEQQGVNPEEGRTEEKQEQGDVKPPDSPEKESDSPSSRPEPEDSNEA